jgi:hypothetical protein
MGRGLGGTQAQTALGYFILVTLKYSHYGGHGIRQGTTLSLHPIKGIRGPLVQRLGCPIRGQAGIVTPAGTAVLAPMAQVAGLPFQDRPGATRTVPSATTIRCARGGVFWAICRPPKPSNPKPARSTLNTSQHLAFIETFIRAGQLADPLYLIN